MKRKCLADHDCPVARSLDAVGDWWSLLIVRDALYGSTRFSDFEAKLGLAKNILSSRLKKLVEVGIFEARAQDGRRKEYVLTPQGRELGMVLIALRLWGTRWTGTGRTTEGPRRVLDKSTNQEVRLELRTAGGDKLNPLEATLVAADPLPATTLETASLGIVGQSPGNRARVRRMLR